MDIQSFELPPFLHTFKPEEYQELSLSLKEAGYEILEINGQAIDSAATFLAQAKENLPLDPPLISKEMHWDAFSDSLFEGITNLPAKNIALIWHKTSNFAKHNQIDYEKTIAELAFVAETAANQEYADNQVKKFLVFLEARLPDPGDDSKAWEND